MVVGVLAAIVTGQYQKMVEESYRVEALNMLSGLKRAEEAYREQYGHYDENLDTLLPSTGVMTMPPDRRVHWFHYGVTYNVGLQGVTTGNNQGYTVGAWKALPGGPGAPQYHMHEGGPSARTEANDEEHSHGDVTHSHYVPLW